jgi:hypothetical protein
MGFHRFASNRSMNKADNNGNGGMKKAGLAPQSMIFRQPIYQRARRRANYTNINNTDVSKTM